MPEICAPCAALDCVACDGRTWVEDAPAICGCWASGHGEDDPYDRVVFVQGHRHSEPICCEPVCQTYLTREQMAALPDVRRR